MSQDSSMPEPVEEEEGELFRREAIEEQGNKLIGDVVILSPPHWTSVTLFYCAVALLTCALLVFGRYQRKEHVQGILLPKKGVIPVVADDDGRIIAVNCQEGEWVKAGQMLFRISREAFLQNTSGKYTNQLIELQAEQSRMELQRSELKERHRIDRRNLESRMDFLKRDLGHIDEMIALKRKQLQESQKTVESAEKLLLKKVIAQSEYDQQLALFVGIRQSLVDQQKRQSEIKSNVEEILIQLEKNSSDLKLATDNLEFRISEGKRRMIDIESQKETILKAPGDGFVSGLRSYPGQSLQRGQNLLTLVPDDAQVEGNLFVSSRSSPFLREGQTVWIRFESLAYTKYGTFPGKVITVSRAAIDPKDINGLSVDGPRYLVKVAMDSQALNFGRDDIKLKAGLQIEADILLDRRSLMEWVLEPLLRLRSSM